jgi:hypothetical protein
MNQLQFGGETFEEPRDGNRLRAQLGRVKRIMLDGNWHTLAELSIQTGDPQASISARIRDLRKQKFGGYLVEREYVSSGLWRYRLLVPA